jgi:(p)ppGpp synthase/HD superfamily hydrolase
VLRGKRVGDLLATRIVVDDEVDCYAVRELVASLWAEDAHRFKDYVRRPKANGYQSLHLTVRLPCGRPLEVQVRTRTMHLVAEHQSAAWGSYKAAAYAEHGVGARGSKGGKRPSSWQRALEGVRGLQALQPERLREALALAAAGMPTPTAIRRLVHGHGLEHLLLQPA